MTQQEIRRHDVIMAGIGGKGVLMAGMLLVEAAAAQYEHVVWLPSYTTLMRGGPCECTVVLSSEEITSPIVSYPQAVIVMEPSGVKLYRERLKPGGTLILESAGLKEEIGRDDVKVLKIPAVETAVSAGDIRAANLVLLGAYIEVEKVVPPELIERELDRRLRRRESLLAVNKEAFQKGLLLAREHKKEPL